MNLTLWTDIAQKISVGQSTHEEVVNFLGNEGKANYDHNEIPLYTYQIEKT